MKNLILIFLPLLLIYYAYSQEESQPPGPSIIQTNPIKRNTIFLEAGGTGGLLSVNYDRIMHRKNSFLLAGRVGLCAGTADNYFGVGIPLEFSTLFGNRSSFFELGLGFTNNLVFDHSPNISYNLNGVPIMDPSPDEFIISFSTIRIGYRYQNPEGGLFFKIGFTPIIPLSITPGENIELERKIIPFGGFAIGYTLK